MSSLSYVLPALACPVAMGGMMWTMMRSGQSKGTSSPDVPPATDLHGSDGAAEREIGRLRAELDVLRTNPDSLDRGNRGPAASTYAPTPAVAKVGTDPA